VKDYCLYYILSLSPLQFQGCSWDSTANICVEKDITKFSEYQCDRIPNYGPVEDYSRSNNQCGVCNSIVVAYAALDSNVAAKTNSSA
jgi:hypothetical protein